MCSRSTSPTKRDTLRLRCAACTRVHAAVSLSRVMVTFFTGWLARDVRGRTYYTDFVYLGLERPEVRGDRHHVLDAELRDHRFHQLGQGAGAVAVLHVVQLADDVDRRAPGDARHLAQALERRAVADGAGNGLPPASAPHPRPAFREAARPHVV